MIAMPPTLPYEKKSTPPRQTYSKLPKVINVPNLIDIQLASFKWFLEQGIKELLADISPINGFTGNRMELEFV